MSTRSWHPWAGRIAAAVGGLAGASVLIGWVLGEATLRHGFATGATVHPGIALLTVLAAQSLWALTERGAPSTPLLRGTGLASTLAILLLSGLVLFAPLLGLPRGFELAPFRHWLATLGDAAPRPLSGGSALIYLLLGAGLLLLRGRESLRLLGRSLGLLLALLLALALGIALYRSATRGTPTSSGFLTAVGVLAVSLGVAFPRPRSTDGLDAREPAAIRGKVSLVLGVAVAMLVLTCGLSLWSTARSLQADASRKASLTRRAELTRLLESLLNAETGQQGYLLTGNPESLARYRGALAALAQPADSAARRDTVLTRRLATLHPLVDQRLGLLARSIQLRDSGRAREAQAVVQAGRGRELMEQIRGGIAGMTAEEDSLTARSSASVRSLSGISFVTNLLAGLLAICFLILAGRTIHRDLRERVAIEAERDRIFTLSMDLLCVASADGYFKRLNPAFTATLGWTVEELQSSPFLEFVHPEDRAATLREVERQTVAGQAVLEFENRYRHKDGSWRVLSWKSVPQPGGLMFATARDITQLHASQAELRGAKEAADLANRAKSDFLAKMSHELRTPLNSIIGFSEILEAGSVGALNEKQRRYVANVLLSGRNLLQLINDILDLSKVEAGRMELVTAPFEVGDALAQAREIVAPLAEKKGLSLTLQVPDALPPLVADQARFKQIMFNLLSNAIKFTPAGGRVGVAVQRAAGNGSAPPALEIAVSDTGSGIAPEHLELIFGEFVQVAGDPQQNHQGTGLGLPLTRKLVELHGGRVWVESAVGRGSVFRFTLPCTAERAPAAQPRRVSPPSDGRGSAGPLVLVVDDDPSSRDLIAHYLEHAGYRAAPTATGLDAVRLARELQPDVITLDLILPDRDGLLVLAQLKSDPDTRRIPVVVVSITERSELGMSLGAEEWLVKPVQQDVFLRALDAATSSAASGGKRTILVVDDDPTAVEYLSELVRQRGCEVLAAANGREGIALALRHSPDAIILDLAMPVMNGFEVVHALRENSRTRATPILIVTAMDLSLTERQRLLTGVQGIVRKGWQQELLSELARVCHHPEHVAV